VNVPNDPRLHDQTWRFLRLAFSGAVWVLFRPIVHDREAVPARGAVLLVSNHQSFFDIPVLGYAQPRTLRFMAKSELFGFRPFAWLIARGGAFPVRRGEADREALRILHETVENEGVVAIFIEGTRHAEIAEAKAGAGRAAVVEDVTVVPVAIRGTRNWRPGRRAHIAFGTPRRFGVDGRRRGDAYREVADELMNDIKALYERAR
jgi:1-acyl-sn-glycerol-3-phosphate acyltransferase